MSWSRRTWWALGGVAALVALRVAIVLSWHQPAGDGIQYYRLAQNLRASGRFAFAAPPAPLVYSRLPGYPLFLAYVALPGAPATLEHHLVAATLWNVVFDLGTALLVLATARRLGLRRAWAAGLALLAWPTLWLMSAYGLTESMATLATAAELYFAVRLMQRGRWGDAAAAGAIAGWAQLVRLDAVTMLPVLLWACAVAPGSRRARVGLGAVVVGVAALVFAPWPIRNYVRFGAPHPAATTWRTAVGKPLGDGPVWWARTWAASGRGDSYFELYFVYEAPIQIARPGVVPERSYDDEAERQEVVKLFTDYNAHGLTDAVDAEFRAVARARLRRHPLRTLLLLPLERIGHLFAGEPEYEMPMRIRWLGLPTLRPLFGALDLALVLAAAVGCVLGWRARRRLIAPLLLAIAMRLGIYAFAIPQATTERYLVEAFPLFMILAFVGFDAIAARRAR